MPSPLLVRLESCPLRALGPYGCEWLETPALDRFAAAGIVYDNHYAAGPIGHSPYDAPSIPFEEFARLDHFDDCQIVTWNPFQALHAVSEAELPGALAKSMQDFDEQFGALDETLPDRTVILTADMGFPLGEHDVIGLSNARPHEELVHLPLIIRHPQARDAGLRIAELTQPDGILLQEFCIPGVDEVISWTDDDASIRTAESCLIMARGNSGRPTMLFELPDDRHEVNDLAARQPERVEELSVRILAQLAKFKRP